MIAPDVGAFALISGPSSLLVTLIWRLFFSRAAWSERVGAGPRGKPACDNKRVYTLGATGIVNAVDDLVVVAVAASSLPMTVHGG